MSTKKVVPLYLDWPETRVITKGVMVVCWCYLPIQSEVASLAEASAKEQATLFTPYLLPDAKTLCNMLHLVKKLLKTERFVFLIAKSGTWYVYVVHIRIGRLSVI